MNANAPAADHVNTSIETQYDRSVLGSFISNQSLSSLSRACVCRSRSRVLPKPPSRKFRGSR